MLKDGKKNTVKVFLEQDNYFLNNAYVLYTYYARLHDIKHSHITHLKRYRKHSL